MKRILPLFLLCAPLAAHAEVKVRLAGEYRLRANAGTGLEVSPAGCDGDVPDRSTCVGGSWAEHRLRLSPSIEPVKDLVFAAEADFLNGVILGRRTAGFDGIMDRTFSSLDGFAFTEFTPRRLSVNWLSPVGRVVLGLLPANWGSGIVANNGSETPEWGENRFGDTALRALFATQPLAKSNPRKDVWTLLAAVDLTYKDESASLVDGDQSWQFILASQVKPIAEWTLGMYTVTRLQENHDGNEIQAFVLDAMTSYLRKLADDAEIKLDGEIAWIRGRTNTVRNAAAMGMDPEGADWLAVDQLGAMLRARYTRGDIGGEVEAGYASGDENPFDGAATNFSFDRDYNVSLLMFEEVMAWESAASARRVADPNIVNEPPVGFRRLATGGAVTNAFYVKPTVRWTPMERTTVALAALWARAPSPVVDPYNTNAQGGGPRNFYNAPAGQNYGVEIDAGVKYELFAPPAADAPATMFVPQIVLGAQAGVFFPGDVFAKPDGTKLAPQLGGALRAAVRF